MAWKWGTYQDDTIYGTSENDWIFGFWGHDKLYGGSGSDFLFGGYGNDLLVGDSGENFVKNGSFEDLTGLTATGFGFTGDIPEWTNTGNGTPEIVESGWVGMPAAEGDYWIDTGTLGSRVIDISQAIEGLEAGQSYDLSFQAGHWQPPSAAPDETLNVYWNGELIATVRPEAVDSYELFSFEIVAGSGDGSNTLRFQGVTDGTSDAQGVVIDDVKIAQVGDDKLFGGHGNDEMIGGGGDDLLWGGHGNDINTGGSGADCFVFGSYDGTDTITDFEFGVDTIKIKDGYCWSSADFDDLQFSQVDGDTMITFRYTNIIVENSEVGDFSADDFIFV